MKAPQVFIGEFSANTGEIVQDIRANGWGRMWVMLPPTLLPGEPWAFDNGAFRDFTASRAFNGDAYRWRLGRAYRTVPTPPTVAIAPDIVAGGMRSLEFSLSWREELPDEWPWYLAVQDGMPVDDVRPVLDRFAGIFLGGTSRFKYTGPLWARLARELGKRFHYGRAGTPRKLDDAYLMQADSLDSALPLWTRERWREFNARWRTLRQRHRGVPVSLLAEGVA